MEGNEPADPAAISRLCLAVDIASYSSRTRIEQFDVQNRLLWAIAQGCLAAGITPARCDREDSGDGQILVLPPAVDEAKVIPGLVRGLLTGLYRVNHPAGQGRRLQVRVSLGRGAIQMGRLGFVSPSLIAVCRLLDSDELRDVLSVSPDSDAALIVTTDLFDDMVSQGYGGLPAAGFSRIRVRKKRKGFDAEAWVQVPASRPLLATVPGYPDPADLRRRQEKAPGVPGGLLPVAVATALAWATFAVLNHASDEPATPGGHHPAPHAPGHGDGRRGDGQHAGTAHPGPVTDGPGHPADPADSGIHYLGPAHQPVPGHHPGPSYHDVHDVASHPIVPGQAVQDGSSADQTNAYAYGYGYGYNGAYGYNGSYDGTYDASYDTDPPGTSSHHWFHEHSPGHHPGTL